MSVTDNLLANSNKLSFTSYFDVDKVAIYSSTDDSSGAGVGHGVSIIANAAVPDGFNISTATIANPYGKRCLMTLSWSLDNINFYPAGVPIFYFNATFQEYLWQALSFGGCSDSLIYLTCTTQFGSNQKIFLQFALDSPT